MDATRAIFDFLAEHDRNMSIAINQTLIAEFEQAGGAFFPATLDGQDVYVLVRDGRLITYAREGTDITTTDYGPLRRAVLTRTRVFRGGNVREGKWSIRHEVLPGDLVVDVDQLRDQDQDAVQSALESFAATEV